jgi:hypothetical protein
MDDHRKGKAVAQQQLLPIFAVSNENLRDLLPTIRRNVLGQNPK